MSIVDWVYIQSRVKNNTVNSVYQIGKNYMINYISALLGFVRLRNFRLTKRHKSTLEDRIISKNFFNNKTINLQEFVEHVLKNKDHELNTEETCTYSSIFKKHSVINKHQHTIVVLNPSMKRVVNEFTEEKAFWQYKTNSVIIYSENISWSRVAVIYLNKEYKRFVNLRDIEVKYYPLVNDYRSPKYYSGLPLPDALRETGEVFWRPITMDPEGAIKRAHRKNAVKRLERPESEENKLSEFSGTMDTSEVEYASKRAARIRKRLEQEPETHVNDFSGIVGSLK